MGYQYDASCSSTLNRIWTKSAIDCYSIGCVCSKCYLYKVFFSKKNYKCKMKAAVIELIKNIGVPDKKNYNNENKNIIL